MSPTLKEMATVAAEDVFKTIVSQVFPVLDSNLTTAGNDANARQEALNKAKLGIASAKATHAACREIADSL